MKDEGCYRFCVCVCGWNLFDLCCCQACLIFTFNSLVNNNQQNQPVLMEWFHSSGKNKCKTFILVLDNLSVITIFYGLEAKYFQWLLWELLVGPGWTSYQFLLLFVCGGTRPVTGAPVAVPLAVGRLMETLAQAEM